MQSLAVEVGPEIMARHTKQREINAVYLSAIARPGRRAKERVRPAPEAA
jgi:hypothetical protein